MCSSNMIQKMFFLPKGCPLPLSLVDPIYSIALKCCSSLLSTLEVTSSRRRSPAGSSTPYVWINRREVVRSTFVRGITVIRSVCVESHGLDLFVGLFIYTLLQLSIKSSAAREVHPLKGCKK